jgi:hypothetical protein
VRLNKRRMILNLGRIKYDNVGEGGMDEGFLQVRDVQIKRH